AYSKAQAKMSARLPGRVAWIGADTLSLPFGNDFADIITSGFGFRNLADYALGLGEMHRILKPEGTLAILEFSRVQSPIFGPLFRFYFARVLPRLGSWISGTAGPYQYLHESASRFPDQEAFRALLQRAGFSAIRYRNLMGGVAALHMAQKR
ncbi:MAG: class I SAM-dependent methyltransferase, partial [Terriglobia bacterium]